MFGSAAKCRNLGITPLSEADPETHDSVLQKARARRAGQRSMTSDEFVTWAYGLTNALRLASYAP